MCLVAHCLSVMCVSSYCCSYPPYSNCSVTQSCLTLCDSMNCSTPSFPVLHHLPEFAQTYVHWVSDAIQPSHPLLPASPPSLNLSQHQGLFQWVWGQSTNWGHSDNSLCPLGWLRAACSEGAPSSAPGYRWGNKACRLSDLGKVMQQDVRATI